MLYVSSSFPFSCLFESGGVCSAGAPGRTGMVFERSFRARRRFVHMERSTAPADDFFSDRGAHFF